MQVNTFGRRRRRGKEASGGEGVIEIVEGPMAK